MNRTIKFFLALPLTALFACSDSNSGGNQGTTTPPTAESIEFSQQAYVVSEVSDELTIIDLSTSPPSIAATLDLNLEPGASNANHMAIVSEDGRKAYITSVDMDTVIVVERESLSVVAEIPVNAHPSHGSARLGANEVWVSNEDVNTVTVIDTLTDTVKTTIAHESLEVPHNIRWDSTNTFAYVANIGGNQITVIDALTYTVSDVIVAEGLTMGACSGDPCGFADTQVDQQGILFSAHIESSTLLIYDTLTNTRLADLPLGPEPWYAHVNPWASLSLTSYLVPNFGDSTISRISTLNQVVTDTLDDGDTESYGVNYSPLAPELGFVMNKNKEQVVIIDLVTGIKVDTLEMGGTVEASATTDDGRYVIIPLSSTGEIVVLDTVTLEEAARFTGVGEGTWSAGVMGGQNYCH